MFALAVAVAHAMALGLGYSHGMVSHNDIARTIHDQEYLYHDGLALAHEDGDDHRLQKRSPLILLPKVLLLKKLLKINKILPASVTIG